MSVPQKDIEVSLQASIDELQDHRGGACSSASQRVKALRVHLDLIKADNERVGQRIRANRHTPVNAPVPLAWIKTREALADRPGVHSGVGYCAFVREWAKAATLRRNDRWGRLLEYDGI